MQDATGASDAAPISGYGVVELIGPDGQVKETREFRNLITDAGDLYYAKMVIANVSPANASQPTRATGMQIGTSSTAAAKNGTGAAIVSYAAGVAFDAGYPQTNNVGAGAGVEARYKATIPAGSGTGTITEATIVWGTVTTSSTAAECISRITFTGVVKAAGDQLAITWNHKFLGA